MRTTPGAGFMKPCALLKLDFLTSAYDKCIALVRKSSFSKAQGLHKTGPCSNYSCFTPDLVRARMCYTVPKPGYCIHRVPSFQPHKATYATSRIITYPAYVTSVASRHATTRNIADLAVTWLQLRSNTCNDAAVV